MKKLVLVLAFLLFPVIAQAACPNADTTHPGNECIVKANGTGSTCSEASPCSFVFVTGVSTIAAAGDEVWVRDDGGTYIGRFTFDPAFDGTVGNEIIVRPHCGANHICEFGMGDDHKPKFDAYNSTTLTAAMLGPLDAGYDVDCTVNPPNNYIQLADASLIAVGDVLQLPIVGNDGERVSVFGKSGNTINNCLRAWDATTAVAHANGSTVGVFGSTFSDAAKNVIFRDLEIFNTYPDRVFSSGVAGDWNTKRGSCIFYFNNAASTTNKYINNVIHDCNHSLFTSSDSASLVFYGNLTFHNGLTNTDANGPGWYTENSAPETKSFEGNVGFSNWSASCGKLYSEQSGKVENFTVKDNVCFNAGAAVAAQSSGKPSGWTSTTRTNTLQLGSGGTPPTNNNTFTGNIGYNPLASTCIYTGGLWLGYQAPSASDGLTVTNNYIVSCRALEIATRFNNMSGSGNTFVQPLTGTSQSAYMGSIFRSKADSTYSWNNNTYYDRRTSESAPPDTGRFSFGYFSPNKTQNTFRVGCCFSADGGGNDDGASALMFTSSNLNSGAASTTLNGAIDNATCTITLTSGTGFVNGNGMKIDSEVIFITTISGANISACVRGYQGTSAASHSNGATVDNCKQGICNTGTGTGFKEWSGLDASSTYNAGVLPTTNVQACIPNAFETGRGNCYIFNWQGQASPSLTISGLGLTTGDTYAIWDTQNWTDWNTNTAIVTGVYSSVSPTVTIPMSTLTTVRKPVGMADTITHTADSGNAGGFFNGIIRKTGTQGGAVDPTGAGAGRMRGKPSIILFNNNF